MKLNKCRQLVAGLALLGATATSHAGLVFDSTVNLNGTGYGNVDTILTLQNVNGNNSDGLTSGSVFRAGGEDDTDGMVLPGQSHSATYSFGELDITSASQLMLIFNAAESQNADEDSIRIDTLMLSIFSDVGGQALFTVSLQSPVDFDSTLPGIGRAGFAFVISDDQLEAVQKHISASNRIGLSASLSSANGANDTFFVFARDEEGEGPGNEIPEPGSVALLGLGIAGMTALRRRSRKS